MRTSLRKKWASATKIKWKITSKLHNMLRHSLIYIVVRFEQHFGYIFSLSFFLRLSDGDKQYVWKLWDTNSTVTDFVATAASISFINYIYGDSLLPSCKRAALTKVTTFSISDHSMFWSENQISYFSASANHNLCSLLTTKTVCHFDVGIHQLPKTC